VSSISGPRLTLESLREEHADEMFPLLNDASLHTFTGGGPSTLAQLRDRYRRQVAGHSPDGTQRWLNWVVRRREDGQAVGTLQATVTGEQAEVAWVVASPYQGRGFAREAAEAMVGWLREQGVTTLVAHVHPDHKASARVAAALGLSATATVVDGEIRWQSRP
jgi:RimJ/RimL family protein N-acetyltransferase